MERITREKDLPPVVLRERSKVKIKRKKFKTKTTIRPILIKSMSNTLIFKLLNEKSISDKIKKKKC